MTNPDISKPGRHKPHETMSIFSFSCLFSVIIKSFLRSLKKILYRIKKRKNKKKKKSSRTEIETTEFEILIHYFAGNLQSAHKMWERIITKLNERKSYGTHQQGGDPRKRRNGPP